MKRTGDSVPNDPEFVASIIENSLTYLACSDCYLKSDVTVDFIGMRDNMVHIFEALKDTGVSGDSLISDDACWDDNCHLLFGPPPNAHARRDRNVLTLLRVDRVGLRERLMLKTWGILRIAKVYIPEIFDQLAIPLAKSSRTMIKAVSGLEPTAHKTYSAKIGASWCPLSGGLYEVAKTKRISGRNQREVSTYTFVSDECGPAFAVVARWARLNLWSIELSVPSAPRIRLTTDPVGVRAMLKDRDRPHGATRRPAIIHWVKQHWRKNRKDPEAEHQVRNYLRGKTSCVWMGLECRINPSTTTT